jgi:hypothetical protein
MRERRAPLEQAFTETSNRHRLRYNQVIDDLQALPVSQTSRLLTEPFRRLEAHEPNVRRLVMKIRIIIPAFARSLFGTIRSVS